MQLTNKHCQLELSKGASSLPLFFLLLPWRRCWSLPLYHNSKSNLVCVPIPTDHSAHIYHRDHKYLIFAFLFYKFVSYLRRSKRGIYITGTHSISLLECWNPNAKTSCLCSRGYMFCIYALRWMFINSRLVETLNSYPCPETETSASSVNLSRKKLFDNSVCISGYQ